jgi:hypothetical protein
MSATAAPTATDNPTLAATAATPMTPSGNCAPGSGNGPCAAVARRNSRRRDLEVLRHLEVLRDLDDRSPTPASMHPLRHHLGSRERTVATGRPAHHLMRRALGLGDRRGGEPRSAKHDPSALTLIDLGPARRRPRTQALRRARERPVRPRGKKHRCLRHPRTVGDQRRRLPLCDAWQATPKPDAGLPQPRT